MPQKLAILWLKSQDASFPLATEPVRYVPEEFVSSFVKYCAGVTGYPVVLAPSVGDSVEGNYLGLYRVLVGVWGKHTAHFMTVFGYGAVRYEYLWHHLTVCPYFPDDLVAQKYKTFCYINTFAKNEVRWSVVV